MPDGKLSIAGLGFPLSFKYRTIKAQIQEVAQVRSWRLHHFDIPMKFQKSKNNKSISLSQRNPDENNV